MSSAYYFEGIIKGGHFCSPLKSCIAFNPLPLNEHREELNTIVSYMCLLAQKSASTNWPARRFYWHELTCSRDVREVFESA